MFSVWLRVRACDGMLFFHNAFSTTINYCLYIKCQFSEGEKRECLQYGCGLQDVNRCNTILNTIKYSHTLLLAY